MKRIFSLLIAVSFTLLASAQVTSLDEVKNDRAYTLYNPFFTAYAVHNADKSNDLLWVANMTASDREVADQSYATAVDLTSPSSSWMIVQYSGNWYVYNLGAQKFLAVGYNASNANTASAKLTDTPTAVQFEAKADGSFSLISHKGDQNYLCAAPQLPYPVSVWYSSDGGAQWKIQENPSVEADYETCLEKLKASVVEMVSLTIDTRHGYVWSTRDGGAMPNSIAKGKDFTFYTRARYGWNCNEGLTIRHGEEEYVVADIKTGAYATEVTIPAEKVDGDVTITGVWERDPSVAKAQVLSFSDEFNGKGEPTSKFWKRTSRESSTWNRWCSNSPLVVYEEGGALHCRAIPNPDTSTDDVPMITGGIKTQGKFDFRYGRAEARIKNKLHTGNFPAFWMMPTDNSKGWPNNGEIDIWEVIDSEDRAYGTVHTNWSYNLGKGGNGGTMSGVDYDLWHIFAVEWDATSITWYVDGQKMWTFNKSTDPEALSQGQWPFDAPFYLILNQSVGNGSWARPADTSFTYETLFDWVRVYQKPEHTGIEDVLPESSAPADAPADAACYDLSGRRVNAPDLQGVFVQNGRLIVK